jgi:plasmid maintenance system killer protein
VEVCFTVRSRRLFRKLDAQNRRDADGALATFVRDPTTPGLNFEKLRGYERLYSIRMNRNYRIILLRTEVSDTYEIWDVGPHDIYRPLREGDD